MTYSDHHPCRACGAPAIFDVYDGADRHADRSDCPGEREPCWHCGGQHWGDMPGSCPLAPPPEPVDDDGGYPITGVECDRCGSDYRTGTAYGRTLCRPCQAEEAEQ